MAGTRNLMPAAFAILLVLLTLPVSKAQQPQPLEVIKIDSNLVSVPVIVSDRENRYLPGLKVENFKLYDNNSQQSIAFFDAAEEPLNVALVLDTSRSTEGALGKIKEAARHFLKGLRNQDRAMVISFDFAVHQLSPLTSDRKILEQAIERAAVGEFFGTTLFDAVTEIIERDFKPITGRKAIILLTDGEDHGSRISSAELLASAVESDTMIYSIYYAPEPGRAFGSGGPLRRRGGGIFGPRWPQPFEMRDSTPGQFPQRRRRDQDLRRERREERRQDAIEFLTELSEETSGRFYRSDVTNLRQSFEFIAAELRHQYRLGFYPKIADGRLHSLKVNVDRPDVAVRARRQYRTAPPK